jgi:predicted DNA-binding protein with PD1-like motif/glutaredoxin
MHAVPLHLEAGSDVRRSLEQLSGQHQAGGFVLGVVGNLSQAAFACPGKTAPTVLQGELEIITLQGTLSPDGVHLHLSFSDADCQVWGGHLEHGTLVLRGADLLVGFLTEPGQQPGQSSSQELAHARVIAEPRVEIATLPGCPFSRRALRMLRTLGIPFLEIQPTAEGSVPQLFIDGMAIGGYDALAELHSRGDLEALRQP